ncbi:hypothetical protein QTP86_004894 [Hemibagrus guttatus]|nr:hypothetical protein QTP86_004894 [Hemibagrus guttatus]
MIRCGDPKPGAAAGLQWSRGACAYLRRHWLAEACSRMMSQRCRAGLLATEQSCTGMEGLKDGEMEGWLNLISSRSKKVQDDKDLVHEFVVAEGLICLIKVGAEADQNYQNYILRACLDWIVPQTKCGPNEPQESFP